MQHQRDHGSSSRAAPAASTAMHAVRGPCRGLFRPARIPSRRDRGEILSGNRREPRQHPRHRRSGVEAAGSVESDRVDPSVRRVVGREGTRAPGMRPDTCRLADHLGAEGPGALAPAERAREASRACDDRRGRPDASVHQTSRAGCRGRSCRASGEARAGMAAAARPMHPSRRQQEGHCQGQGADRVLRRAQHPAREPPGPTSRGSSTSTMP